MAAVRHQVYADLDDDFETSRVRTLAIMQRMNAHADFSEGVASFIERREPVFDPLPAGFDESLRDCVAAPSVQAVRFRRSSTVFASAPRSTTSDASTR